MDALPARTRVRLTCGMRMAPPTACMRVFGCMQPCNGGALFTWSTAGVTHCHFHSSFYFSSSSWEWEGGPEFTSMPPFFFHAFWLLFHLYFPSHISKHSFLICIQSLLTSLPSFQQFHFTFFLPPFLPPMSRLSRCCSFCQDMNNWGVLSLVSRWWDGRYGSIGTL